MRRPWALLLPMMLAALCGCSSNGQPAGDFSTCTGQFNASPGQGPYWTRMLIARSKDGINFSRPAQAQDGLLFDRGDVPDAVMLPNGRILVYFVAACKKDASGEHGVNDVSAAVSDDSGHHWYFRNVQFKGLPSGAGSPFDPNAVILDGGQVRLFTSLIVDGTWQTSSSVSTDGGLVFTYEGPRYTPPGGAADPEVYRFPGGIWQIMTGGPHGWAVSTDDGNVFTDRGWTPVSGGPTQMMVIQDISATDTVGKYRAYVPHGKDIQVWVSTASPWDAWTLVTNPDGTAHTVLSLDASAGLEKDQLGFPTVVKGVPEGYLMVYTSFNPACTAASTPDATPVCK